MTKEGITTITNDDVYWEMDWGSGKPKEIIFEDNLALAVLLANEQLLSNSFWWEDSWPEEARKNTTIAVICNDIFYWASADAERMYYSDIKDVYDHWLKDPVWGTAVWCIKRRKQRPQPPVWKAIQEAGIWNLNEIEYEENVDD